MVYHSTTAHTITKIMKKSFLGDSVMKFDTKHSLRDKDITKFCLMLLKGVYPYQYMYSWQRFNKTSLPDKKKSYR